ncbi:GNAT family N-acetyltransferase [Hoeflea sp. AS60]|uniref:GNAT family N-acetyltransferase n=1 Tax=Hoeflea sp. AS60 TaxID=3135780 RepID=UPI0031744795
MMFRIIELNETDIAQAVQIWQNGWHDAHASIVPKELVELRTSESFLQRLREHSANTRIGTSDGEPLGLCITEGDELYQMYVSPKARGLGLAQALMVDAEDRLRSAGHSSVWLKCAVGNDRAARFYAKCGWTNAGTRTVELDTTDGVFPLQIWRFEKTLI